MGRRDVRGRATIASARRPGTSESDGDEFFLVGLASHAFGKERWDLELDVEVPGWATYRVSGTWRVPNRLWKVRKILDGPGRLFPGIVVPVVVDAGNASKVDIDWDDFKSSGSDAQLYPDTGSVRQALSGLLADLRSTTPGEAAPKPRPAGDRPTAAVFPPIEGVDYDTWMRAVVGVMRHRVPEGEQAAHYEARGFPAGRALDVSAAWFDRVKADARLRVWYVYDCDTLEPS
ncbi:MAG: hypothetical protein M3527_06595 [Actinomycetota bacterium]|nr:hypothetical protein [Acidimicrobiia bacterium]MDQ3294099.1 hypothetical protein [Actinomycetota bacterium]